MKLEWLKTVHISLTTRTQQWIHRHHGENFEDLSLTLKEQQGEINYLGVSAYRRASTAREEKGWGQRFFRQIEPNWPLPYSTMPIPRFRNARPTGWVTYCSICTSTMPRAQKKNRKRFNYITKTIHFSYLPIIYLCCISKQHV